MTRSTLRCRCLGEMVRDRDVAASGCVLLPSSHSVNLLSISWFDCWVVALWSRNYGVLDGGLRACWLHPLLMECGMRRREVERGGSNRSQQQNWKILHRSTWTVKEKSPGCAVAGYHRGQCFPDYGQLKCGMPEKRKGQIAVQGKEGKQISKTQGDDLSHRNALPVPGRLMKMWQDWTRVWWGETETQKG